MYSSVGHWNFQNFKPELIVLINLIIFSPSRPEHFDAGTPDSAAFSISSGDSCSINGDDSEDFMYSVSNPPTPQLARRKHASEAESENTFVSGMSDQSNSSGNTVMSDKQNMFINSTEAILGKVLFTQTYTECKYGRPLGRPGSSCLKARLVRPKEFCFDCAS